jgi:DNA-binding beta-propeller fold protein YncE
MSASAAPIATDATMVIGQPDLTANQPNQAGSANDNTLAKPQKLVYDAQSNLWIADTDNNRVLMFKADPATKELIVDPQTQQIKADLVIGQPDFVTVTPAVSDVKLDKPVAIALDQNENVYVVDRDNNRVVMFEKVDIDAALAAVAQAQPQPVIAAKAVIGQPDMNTKVAQPTSAESLNQPVAVEIVQIIDPATQAVTAEKVVIADAGNHRVLVIDQAEVQAAIATPADVPTAEFVIGQPVDANPVPGLFDENSVNLGGIAANTLHSPVAIAVDEIRDPATQNVVDQKLIIADRDNHRVLVHDLPIVADAPVAEQVIGQVDPTVANVVTPPTASSINTPTAIVVDDVNDRLLIADSADNRVLAVALPITQDNQPAVQVFGQDDMITAVALPAAANTVKAPLGVAIDPVTQNVAIADADNSRVLVVPEVVVTKKVDVVQHKLLVSKTLLQTHLLYHQ